MKRFSKELIIGASVLVAALVLFAGINYLKGINVFKAANYYYVTYENVAGLAVSAPVNLNGFKVGEVRDIEYDYSNPGHVNVELSLDRHLAVPAGSEAIIETSILGTSTIRLEFSDSKDTHTIGDHLVGKLDAGMIEALSHKIMPAIDSTVPQIDSLLRAINRLVGDSALLASVQRLDAITANLAAATGHLNRTLASLPKTMQTVNSVAGNLDSITADLAQLSTELKELPLKQTMDNVESVSANMVKVTDKLNSSDNSLGLLLNDRGLYDNINAITLGLDSIVIDVKKNPRRYLPSIKIF